MSSHKVSIIDYSIGNLLSVQRSLEYCGAKVKVVTEPEDVLTASHIVLPGVGAFADGMTELRRNGLDAALLEAVGKGVPLLGICLGMQLLLDEGEEFGISDGLGLISGRVVHIPSTDISGHPQKIPHIGWNELIYPQGQDRWHSSLLQEVEMGEAVYFVHSFMAEPAKQEHRLADCNYGGIRVAAMIQGDNVYGCQFHPEKSGKIGLKILEEFIKL